MNFFSSLQPSRLEILRSQKIQWRISNLLLIYIIYRAVSLELTVDEAYSYNLVKTDNWKTLMETSNTHLLNSLFMKLGTWLPGINDDPWKLRLFSIICWPIYTLAAIRLSSFFRIKWLGFLFFIIVISNPFTICFFSIARGYAPACTFVLLSMWQAAKLLQQSELAPRKWILVFLFAGLSVISNYSFFYFFTPFVGIYLLNLLINKKLNLLFINGGWKTTLLAAAVLIFVVFALLNINDLYYGGQSDIINSLLGSLFINMEYYNLSVPFEQTIDIIFITGIIAFVSSWFFYLKSRNLKLSSLAAGIFVAIVVLNLILHAINGTPYLLGRTALPIFFPLLIAILMGLDNLISAKFSTTIVFKSLSPVVCTFLIIMFAMNFFLSIDFNYIKEWRSDLRKQIDYVQQENAKKVGIFEGTFRMFHNYYAYAFPGRYSFGREMIPFDDMKKPVEYFRTAGFDYLLINSLSDDEKRLIDSFEVVKNYPDSKSVMLKVK